MGEFNNCSTARTVSSLKKDQVYIYVTSNEKLECISSGHHWGMFQSLCEQDTSCITANTGCNSKSL